MFLTLAPDLVLEPNPESGFVALRKTTASGRSLVFPLHPFQGLALALLDGTRSETELLDVLEAVFERDPIETRRFWEVLKARFRQFLVEAQTPRLAERPLSDYLFKSDRDFRVKFESAPQTLSWIVTEDCDRKCVYCYKDARFVADGCAQDLHFPVARMLEIVREARDIGVTTMILSGGEPFLHPNLNEVIAELVNNNIEVIPITKARITGARMADLVATGLHRLHLSLDSFDAETVAQLTGVDQAHGDMLATLMAAREAGLAITLRPVLTCRNIDHLGDLVERSVALGVDDFIIDIYGETCGRTDDALKLSDDQVQALLAARDRLVALYPDLRFAFNFEKDPPAEGKGCMEGLRGLTIMPDGTVTKCEHWKGDARLVFGDLKHQSLLACWQGERLQTINHGTRDLFEGTVCFHCKHREMCNDVRGRCSLTSLLAYDTPHAPDIYCPLKQYGNHPKTPSRQRMFPLAV